jgi:hypothetical protein
MPQQTIPLNPNTNVLVYAVSGDLRVAGWDRSEMMVKADGGDLKLDASLDPLTISCDEDVILYLPRSTPLQVQSVAGDASLQALSGPVTLGPIAGDLTLKDLGKVKLGRVSGDASLRNIGALTAETISGDFVLRGGHGVCAVNSIGGDASVRDVDDLLTINQVGSDLYVRNVNGAVTVNAGADATLYLDPLPGQTYAITAGDDLILRLSPDANAMLHLTGGSPDSIQVDFPGVEMPEDCTGCDVLIGTRSGGMADMVLTAGDDLVVTCQPDSELDAANRRAESSSQRASIKIEAAIRRAEAKARAAEVRARRGQANVRIGRWSWYVTPHGPVEVPSPVSDNERLAVLIMLQGKKITLVEAEKLLAALECK